MANSIAPITRFWILLLFGAALLGLVGHQLSLAPCLEISTLNTVGCTTSSNSGQQVIPYAAGCPVHTGYLITAMPAFGLSLMIAQIEVHTDLARPLLLAFPVLHPPA